jgi:hypothetical protein
MSTPIPHVPVRQPVRIPFRVLAAVVGILGMIVVFGTPFLIWRGARVLTVGDVVMLPSMAWFIRWMFYAAVYGTIPADSHYWPFASRNVWTWYIFLTAAYWILSRQ